MNILPIHQNLSTSFVSLSALIVHLRKLQFVGSIRVEMSSYEADIIVNGSRPIRAREYDHIAGRISQGEHAFRRILVRARDPHGRIHVYPEGHKNSAPPIFVDRAIAAGARHMAAGRSDKPARHMVRTILPAVRDDHDCEWETLLDLTGELLRRIDDALAKANLNFSGAFTKACADVAEDYPFLDPENSGISYQFGDLAVKDFVDPAFFTSGIAAALRVVMARIQGRPKLAKVHHFTVHRMRTLVRDHKRLCDRFHLTAEIDRLCREP